MNHFFRNLILIGLIGLGLSCGTKESNSVLKRNAVPNDENVTVSRFKDGSKIGYVLISKAKGYELVCDKVLKRKALIQATGFPYEAINDEEPLTIDSQEFLNLKMAEQPKISCDPTNKTLYRSELDGTTKYFFSDSVVSTTRLYMIGCQALIPAMGFDIAAATKIEPSFIDSLGIFTASDDHDVNCLEGFTPATKLKWTSGDNKEVTLKAGQNLDLVVYSAERPDQKPAKLEVTAKEGRCEWLNIAPVSSSIIITGQAPADFFNQSCKLTVVGEEGTFLRDQKTFNISTEIFKPVLTTNCPSKKSILVLNDFTACSVTADRGTIQIQNACEGAFTFDTATGLLKLAKEPLAGKSCTATLSSVLNGVASTALAIEVSRVCQTGYTANAEGSCQKRACDNQHVFDDLWYEVSAGKNGQKQLYCKADGTIEDKGMALCDSGFELRNGMCLKACSAGFVDGDLVISPVANGELARACKNGTTTSNLTCNTNYLKRNDQCQLSCDGLHVESETWSDPVTNGNRAKSCSAGKVASTLTCDSGYLIRNDACSKACDSEHTAGETWPVRTTAGYYTRTCLATGATSDGGLTCDSGYQRTGNSCTLIPVIPPNLNCDEHANGSSWTDYDCGIGGEIKIERSCVNCKVKKLSSTKTGRDCR